MGGTIPSIVFNTRVNAGVEMVNDGTVIALLEDGGAYACASHALM